jgi:hypothetical protein
MKTQCTHRSRQLLETNECLHGFRNYRQNGHTRDQQYGIHWEDIKGSRQNTGSLSATEMHRHRFSRYRVDIHELAYNSPLWGGNVRDSAINETSLSTHLWTNYTSHFIAHMDGNWVMTLIFNVESQDETQYSESALLMVTVRRRWHYRTRLGNHAASRCKKTRTPKTEAISFSLWYARSWSEDNDT